MREVYRQEKKYLTNQVDMALLAGRLEGIMLQDRHNGAQGYWIRSLYFDTLEEGDYTDKLDGVEKRRKLRLRIYDTQAGFAMLEMKQKEGAYQKKRSVRVSREEAEQLAAGRYDCLLNHGDPFAAECYGLLMRKCYRPKAVVDYRRRAFIARENQIRVTLDHQIRASETCMDLFDPALNTYPVLPSFHGVLEVKYNGFLLSYIKEAVSWADRSEISVSKYCLARSATMHFSL